MDRITRGSVVLVAIPGDYGKPRPALVVQSDLFNTTHGSITVVPTTTTLIDAPLFRLTIDPSQENGLRDISQLMIDKITAVRRDRIAARIGQLQDEEMLLATRALALWLGVAG